MKRNIYSACGIPFASSDSLRSKDEGEDSRGSVFLLEGKARMGTNVSACYLTGILYDTVIHSFFPLYSCISQFKFMPKFVPFFSLR